MFSFFKRQQNSVVCFVLSFVVSCLLCFAFGGVSYTLGVSLLLCFVYVCLLYRFICYLCFWLGIHYVFGFSFIFVGLMFLWGLHSGRLLGKQRARSSVINQNTRLVTLCEFLFVCCVSFCGGYNVGVYFLLCVLFCSFVGHVICVVWLFFFILKLSCCVCAVVCLVCVVFSSVFLLCGAYTLGGHSANNELGAQLSKHSSSYTLGVVFLWGYTFVFYSVCVSFVVCCVGLCFVVVCLRCFVVSLCVLFVCMLCLLASFCHVFILCFVSYDYVCVVLCFCIC